MRATRPINSSSILRQVGSCDWRQKWWVEYRLGLVQRLQQRAAEEEKKKRRRGGKEERKEKSTEKREERKEKERR